VQNIAQEIAKPEWLLHKIEALSFSLSMA